MSKTTNISWTDATWNIARGCTKVDEDCKFCYMYRESMNNTRYDPFAVKRTKTVFNLPLKYKDTQSQCWNGKPLIFTCSLTDFFHEEIDSYRTEAWDIIRKCPHLIFQILTKRPERILENLPPYWNEIRNHVWLGTSVGSDSGISRITELITLRNYADVLFISFEPLHGEISNFDISTLCNIDWIIIGGESGNDTGKYLYRPCRIEWIESLMEDFKVTSKIFIKQLGTHLAKELNLSDRHGGNIDEWPEHLKIREFPEIKKLKR